MREATVPVTRKNGVHRFASHLAVACVGFAASAIFSAATAAEFSVSEMRACAARYGELHTREDQLKTAALQQKLRIERAHNMADEISAARAAVHDDYSRAELDKRIAEYNALVESSNRQDAALANDNNVYQTDANAFRATCEGRQVREDSPAWRVVCVSSREFADYCRNFRFR